MRVAKGYSTSVREGETKREKFTDNQQVTEGFVDNQRVQVVVVQGKELQVLEEGTESVRRSFIDFILFMMINKNPKAVRSLVRDGRAQLHATRQVTCQVGSSKPHAGGRCSCDGKGVEAGLARTMHADLGRVQRLLGLACLGLLLFELLHELDNFRFCVLGLLLQRSHQLAMVVAESRRHDGHLDAEQAVLVPLRALWRQCSKFGLHSCSAPGVLAKAHVHHTLNGSGSR